MADNSCWDAFGDDNDDNDDDDDDDNDVLSQKRIDETLLWLTKYFLKTHSKLSDRWIRIAFSSDDWSEKTQARGMTVTQDGPCDVAIVKDLCDCEEYRAVVPGGMLLVCGTDKTVICNDSIWNIQKKTIVYNDDEMTITAIPKYACLINAQACPYKPNTKLFRGERFADMERRLVEQATVAKTAKELVENTTLSEVSVQRAVNNLQEHGYCILKQILNKELCVAWGQAVLDDFTLASTILRSPPHEIDLRNPHSSKNNPQSYRELAMREDLRMDLRDGPHLRKMRAIERTCMPQEGIDHDDDTPVVTTTCGSPNSCLRFHPTILEIIKRTMNPKGNNLYRGNFGRYNFAGTGPDGSPQPLRIGPMGGILSLPGAADQAIHADTPHLFEHMDYLPAHYINAFCLGRDHVMRTDGSTDLGGTAFVQGSHKLSFTASVGDLSAHLVLEHLVRPSLELGDVVLFDCRMLHFGLANTCTRLDRPLLYVNYTMSWFHDPKNWNDRKPIFLDENSMEYVK